MCVHEKTLSKYAIKELFIQLFWSMILALQNIFVMKNEWFMESVKK